MSAHRTYRPWTALEQRRCVELRRAGHTFARVAALLGRTFYSVTKKLEELRVKHPTRTQRKPGALKAAVKRMWKPGRSDAEMARSLKTERRCVSAARKRLGLPAGITHVEAGNRSVAAMRARNDGRCGGQVSHEREYVRSFHEGWPVHSTERMGEYLDVLHRAGRPLGVNEWAARAGVCPHTLAPSVTKAVLRGWVTRDKRSGVRGGFYALASEVAARRVRVLVYRSEVIPA